MVPIVMTALFPERSDTHHSRDHHTVYRNIWFSQSRLYRRTPIRPREPTFVLVKQSHCRLDEDFDCLVPPDVVSLLSSTAPPPASSDAKAWTSA
ncbi:hypothetical protein H257_18237, partial [Aphanomyces astaci]